VERRDWSLRALNRLVYIDSLDSQERVLQLIEWNSEFLSNSDIKDFELDARNLEKLLELFYKNISFLKKHKEETRENMLKNRKTQRFLKH